MKQNDENISKKVIFLLFSIFFLVGLFTFKDYGISVDEEYGRSAGFYWLNYILSFTSFDELKNLVGTKLNQIKGFTLPSPVNNPYFGVIFDHVVKIKQIDNTIEVYCDNVDDFFVFICWIDIFVKHSTFVRYF